MSRIYFVNGILPFSLPGCNGEQHDYLIALVYERSPTIHRSFFFAYGD